MTPPSILRYNASSVPILQLSISSDTMSEQSLYDFGYNFIRTQMATVQGASFPLPYGGRPRQIMVDLDPEALYAQGLSANDVVNAVNTQSLILPSGIAKIGAQRIHRAPQQPAAVRRSVQQSAHQADQRHHGLSSAMSATCATASPCRPTSCATTARRGALLTVLKNGGSSTLDIVARIKEILPRIRSTLPAALNLKLMFDQSIFVRAAINGVLREAIIAALLTGLMILLFLGSWRSTVIVCISIPLSILTSLAIMNLLGETINVMTLGGLALAVGILVDDATVEIENIHRNLAHGQAHHAGHSGRRHADRRSRLRFHAVHLHRLRAGDLPDRRGALSVHAAGPGGGAGHDGLLPSFAHPRSHHGASTCCAAKRTATSDESGEMEHAGRRLLRRHPSRLPDPLRAHARRATAACSPPRWRIASWWPPASGLICVACAGADSVSRHGLLSASGCRPDPPARARPRRHPHRRNRSTISRRWKTPSAALIPPAELSDILDNIGLPY